MAEMTDLIKHARIEDPAKYTGPYAELTGRIIGAAIEVHRELGPGLLENAYEQCFCHEMYLRNIRFRRQIELPVTYKVSGWIADIP